MFQKTITLLFLTSLILTFSASAQSGHRADIHPDSLSDKLWADLDKGLFEFHMRTFAMSTVNEAHLNDYFTLASGAGIGYYSPSFHNFHVGFSGFFVFQLHEHNLHIEDNASSQISRYERQLYDLNDPENSTDLDRLEELYLTYELDHIKFNLGRQKVESPLMNENDNRMRPHIFSGLSSTYEKNHLKLHGGWYTSETVRGTLHWYKIDHTFGIYGVGRNPLGDTVSYRNNISTRGIGLLGGEYKKKHLEVKAWNYLSDNVFNLSFGQVDYEIKRKKLKIELGVQGLYQTAVNTGGNTNPSMAYILPDEQTYAIGGKIGLHRKSHNISLNYFGISEQGRYLFPREWGREVFYASLPRERFEGYGDLNAYVIKYKFDPEEKPYWFSLNGGFIDQPDINNLLLNKYEIDDYFHLTGEFDYKFDGYFEGLDLKFVAAAKIEEEHSSMDASQRHNVVDMVNLSFIIDYRF